MEVSERIKVLCGDIWEMGKSGSLENNTGTEILGEFGYILVETSVYPKFFHMLDVLMGSAPKVIMHELSREVVARDIDTWRKKAIWNVRV